MKIVVIGGSGLIGSKLVTKLDERGLEAIPASPNTGVNTLTGEGLADALAGASVVVDVSNAPSFEDVAGLRGAPGRCLAGCQQLAARALGERLRPDSVEVVVRGSQLLARVNAPVLATKPFAVSELRAGEMDHAAAACKALDRLAVEGLRISSAAEQRA